MLRLGVDSPSYTVSWRLSRYARMNWFTMSVLNDGPREHVVHDHGWDGTMGGAFGLGASSESGERLGDR
jgi:hypothetical protein